MRIIPSLGFPIVRQTITQDGLLQRLQRGDLAVDSSDLAFVVGDIACALEPLVRARTGTMYKREAFIFVSSPNAVTPFHMDPEHNILMQLRGTKTMTLFPAAFSSLTISCNFPVFSTSRCRAMRSAEL